MNPLGNFLERFKSILSSSKNNKDTIQTVIASVARIELAESEIDVRDSILYIKAHPSTRNALFMRKKKILEELEKILGNKTPKDIR